MPIRKRSCNKKVRRVRNSALPAAYWLRAAASFRAILVACGMAVCSDWSAPKSLLLRRSR